MSKSHYDDQTKAAVLAALLEGQAVSRIAAEYNIPPGTVASWKNRAKNAPIANVASEKKEEIGDLLLSYLRTMLGAFQSQAEHFGDVSWMREQNAADMAVLHGVGVDKIMRLLELLGDDSNAND